MAEVGACGADTLSDELMDSLTAGEDFSLPEIDYSDPRFNLPEGFIDSDLYKIATKLTNADLTEANVDGKGTFDVLMQGFKSHLREEYDANRITGADYSKAYVALTESAMGNAVQYLLGRDQSFWAAQNAQLEALRGIYELEIAKQTLANTKFMALTTKAGYALSKLKLSTESIQYCTAKYNLDNILPQQLELLGDQILTQRYNLDFMLPAQLQMVEEQIETQRSQTMDTRSDNITPITGTVGKQKDLYTQQITSYKRDAEVKVAKLFVDSWITQKTIDEGLIAPVGFTNTSLDEVLTTLKINNDLII